MTESAQPASQIVAALPPAVYEAQIADMLAKEDYQGAATLQARQALATGAAAAENPDEENNDAGEDAPWPNNEDEEESSADEQAWPAADEETHTQDAVPG